MAKSCLPLRVRSLESAQWNLSISHGWKSSLVSVFSNYTEVSFIGKTGCNEAKVYDNA
jgi:hypothetical protein